MKTYFVRHTRKLAIEDEFIDALWNSRSIAVHYPNGKDGKVGPSDNRSLDPADYTGIAAGVIWRLNELSKNGGYVCAEYRDHKGCLVGLVKPGTPIKLQFGKWTDKKREAVLKTLPLSMAKHLDAEQSALILVGRPQQGTLSRWRQIQMRVADIVEGRQTEFSLSDVLPPQQEIMCSEYLRLERIPEDGLPRLLHLILPTGRTLRDVDIYGVTTDLRPLFAQVTFQPPERRLEKLVDLRKFRSEKAVLVMFCDCSEPRLEDGVHLFPIKRVLEALRTSPGGRILLTGQFQ